MGRLTAKSRLISTMSPIAHTVNNKSLEISRKLLILKASWTWLMLLFIHMVMLMSLKMTMVNGNSLANMDQKSANGIFLKPVLLDNFRTASKIISHSSTVLKVNSDQLIIKVLQNHALTIQMHLKKFFHALKVLKEMP